jgi:hypothetical protein
MESHEDGYLEEADCINSQERFRSDCMKVGIPVVMLYLISFEKFQTYR